MIDVLVKFISHFSGSGIGFELAFVIFALKTALKVPLKFALKFALNQFGADAVSFALVIAYAANEMVL